MPGFEKNRFIGLEESLAQHLSCSICLNIYRKAVDTDCGHTYCKSCVKRLIDSQNSNCPECRQSMATRKRANSSDDYRKIMIRGYSFCRNFKVNAIIRELKIKCDFLFNGCKEVIQLGVRSTHIKDCKFKDCLNCGFPPGRDHDCVQLLRMDRDLFKRMFEDSQQTIEELKRKVEDLKSGSNSSNSG